MIMQDIKVIAKHHGIKYSKMPKLKLIKTIQLTEGNFDCFASAKDSNCDQAVCSWRDDCFTMAKKVA
ncbi:MAG: SAP domain-containing protein [Gammaproteobacteria bacterium]|nr:SAP domain-containing protein [Gammaproteobacteria bacterium]